MTFTDEDLARWKAFHEYSAVPSLSEAKALIVRLEAAERCAAALAVIQELNHGHCRRLDEWCKAAGK